MNWRIDKTDQVHDLIVCLSGAAGYVVGEETAAEMGYADACVFSRMFRRYLGASPSTYRLRGRERLVLHE